MTTKVFSTGICPHPLVNDDYHAATFDSDGNQHLSSSRAKGIMHKSFFVGGTSASEKGSKIHQMIDDLITHGEHDVIQQTARKGTKAYHAQLADLEEKYPKRNFTLCTASEYTTISTAYLQVQAIVNTLKDAPTLVERSFFVDTRDLVSYADRTGNYLAKFLGAHALKARPDLLVKQPSGKWTLIDFKTTAKQTLGQMEQQSWFLDYFFSLAFYKLVLEICGYTIADNAFIYFLPSSGSVHGCLISVNLTDLDLIKKCMLERYMSHNRMFVDYETSYKSMQNFTPMEMVTTEWGIKFKDVKHDGYN